MTCDTTRALAEETGLFSHRSLSASVGDAVRSSASPEPHKVPAPGRLELCI